jgi:hypothetical protein
MFWTNSSLATPSLLSRRTAKKLEFKKISQKVLLGLLDTAGRDLGQKSQESSVVNIQVLLLLELREGWGINS